MGKDIKGKELGQGISQRSDGRYTARFTNKRGVRIQKYFTNLKDCRKWLRDATFNDDHLLIDDSITVSELCDMWYRGVESHIKPSTKDAYQLVMKSLVDTCGDVKAVNIRHLNIQSIINEMSKSGLNDMTISRRKNVMHNIFEYAVLNDIIQKNPVTKKINCNFGNVNEKRIAMTRDQQRKFIDAISGNRYELNFLFVLETGLRYGELSALRWSDIDFQNNLIHVRKSMFFNKDGWHDDSPKTKNGKRIIPMTRTARNILLKQKMLDKKYPNNEIWNDLVFKSSHGNPIQNHNYHYYLQAIRSEIGMETVLSMHILRHTFATRCIESGMSPKTLQSILGHSDVKITMNVYVHCCEEQKFKEMNKFSMMAL